MHGLRTQHLPQAIPVYNVDGTRNQGGSVTEEVDLVMHYKGHRERVTFSVCQLGPVDVIIGHHWLSKHNPKVNWMTGEVALTRCPPECG